MKLDNFEKIKSYEAEREKKELDFILCSENIKIKDYKVLRNTLSDHLPILLDFEIKKS